MKQLLNCSRSLAFAFSINIILRSVQNISLHSVPADHSISLREEVSALTDSDQTLGAFQQIYIRLTKSNSSRCYTPSAHIKALLLQSL